MQQLIQDISKAISSHQLRVQNFPSLVFLCGGVKNPTGPNTSIRHAYHKHLKKTKSDLLEKIILAEKVNDWLDESPYSNLLSLEDELANLVSAIPIFLESYGSATELGYFVAKKNTCSKILLMLESRFDRKKSFIFLGPAKYLMERTDEKRRFVFPWLNKKGTKLKKPLDTIAFDEITKEIKSIIEHQDHSQQYSSENSSHRILLLCDFINISFVVKFSEILIFFKCMGINASNTDIKKYLLISEKLNLIAIEKYGNTDYYFSPRNNSEDFIIKYPRNTPKIRWKARFRNYIHKHQKEEKHRLRARNAWLEKQ